MIAELLPLTTVRCIAVPKFWHLVPGYKVKTELGKSEWRDIAPEVGETYYAAKPFAHSRRWEFWRVAEGCPTLPIRNPYVKQERHQPGFVVDEDYFAASFETIPFETE